MVENVVATIDTNRNVERKMHLKKTQFFTI